LVNGYAEAHAVQSVLAVPEHAAHVSWHGTHESAEEEEPPEHV
jgi:hypothetical protein